MISNTRLGCAVINAVSMNSTYWPEWVMLSPRKRIRLAWGNARPGDRQPVTIRLQTATTMRTPGKAARTVLGGLELVDMDG